MTRRVKLCLPPSLRVRAAAEAARCSAVQSLLPRFDGRFTLFSDEELRSDDDDDDEGVSV